MIQLLSGKYRRHIAWPMFILFYLQLLSPLYSVALASPLLRLAYVTNTSFFNRKAELGNKVNSAQFLKISGNTTIAEPIRIRDVRKAVKDFPLQKFRIGGPSSPEATSFKAVGSDNLVNLFTGDFSYSIPLLDIGGYPVNLFYGGGVTMEQEAGWVGLGWNINPGTVSRNMRGIPDDFNGSDLLAVTQNVKPNRTWGGELGVDGEILGIKKPANLGLSLGFSYNNYLGPAIDLGASKSLSLATIENIKFEKSATASLGFSAMIGVKLSSRSGLTFSPSLSANLPLRDKPMGAGIGLSTSYNSRTGIKDLTLRSQTSVYNEQNNGKAGDDFRSLTETTSRSLGSSTFSFARPSYLPSLRMPMENSNSLLMLELGGGIFGFRGAVTANGYYSESRVAPESRTMTKPLVGFMYSEAAAGNKNAVMDFTRLNDAEVTPNTPVISAPQYAYDIFSIQGEGTGGSIRAYRGDLGFMRDNVTISKDKNISLGADIAPPGHFGGNWNIISSPARAGGWEDGDNTLLHTLCFDSAQSGSYFENVYFKNPGETTVTNEEMIDRVGGDNLVRFKLSGSAVSARLESGLEMFDKKTTGNKGYRAITGNRNLNREKRTQVTTMLTAKEASEAGLEKYIRNYTGSFDASNNILFDNISRISDYRKAHHISEIDVLEKNGMRYVYGIPVYNVRQKDFTFSVAGVPVNTSENLVAYDTADEPTVNSRHMANSSKIDGYVQTQEIPAYASSFLLTGLLSPDYVDVTGDGITEDDLGNAVKFNYTKSADLHKWRTPRKNGNNGKMDLAHFNEGIRTEKKDNKATISYGEREVWYLNSIESKSMVAIFKTSARNDAKGVINALNGSININENANKKLSRIDLYTKAEIKAKGINEARPLKSVLFEYGYGLCMGSPDNATGGKLTLKSIYFTYNGQNRNAKDKYVFNYGDTTTINSFDNPSYQYNASDRWGIYKNAAYNPSSLTNIDFPYTDTSKSRDDEYAGAWSLKKILLPSGGQMEIQYEADDYAYVQDRRACNMFNIYGLGKTPDFSPANTIYPGGGAVLDNYYVYVKLPRPLNNTDSAKGKREIYTKYLQGLNQLAFKLLIEMPKGPEPLTVYANYDDYGLCTNSRNNDIIYLKLRPVDGKSPLAKSAIGFLTSNLPGQAFPGYETEVNNLPDFLNLALIMLGTLKEAFKKVDDQMRSKAKARTIVLAGSFVRLDNPARMKYGGGVRVKRVVLKDNWNKMTGQYNSFYGQDYDYTTSEKVDGKDITVSSGVASYEPGIGSEENPFREIISFNNRLPLASAEYGAIEMPVLEGFYPSSCVGYSKVTIRSIHRKGTHGDSSLRSAIGKQVTEFYTARDYPSYSAFTPMNSVEYNKDPFFTLFYKEVINRRTISQGFLVETNDMHGKIRSQAAYSESDEKTPVAASYYTYKNTGKNGLDDKVDFVYGGGIARKGIMGVDIELMTDVREFRLQSNGINGQLQSDLFPLGFLVIPVFTMFPLKTYQENLYRAVTCTKLINYHAIEDSVIVMDKGSVVSTKSVAYDAETGSALVTQTANEFNDPIYHITFPAHWAYSGTATAYKNIGLGFKNVNFYDGRIISGIPDMNIFESGDELYITTRGSGSLGCIIPSPDVFKLWVFDKNKNTNALTSAAKDLVFMDSAGRPFTKNGVSFKIFRSGRRNILSLTVCEASCMKNPVQKGKLNIINTGNVLSAAAIEYKEKWQVDEDVIPRKSYYTPPCTSVELDTVSCSGVLEKNINPYLKGLVGNFRPYRSYTYYSSRDESDVNINTAIRRNGYLNNFSNYWNFNTSDNLVPDRGNTKWVWNSELTKVNAKGQELETRDALDRYTAAIYGFNKNMPVALIQNARSGEAFNEDFEDKGYSETINKVKQNNCSEPYIALQGAGSIINTDTSALLKAHSGKYVLKLSPNIQVVKTLDVSRLNATGYNFNYTRDTTKVLNVKGGNFSFHSNAGSYLQPAKESFGYSDFNCIVYPEASNFHYYSASANTYIQIITEKAYKFQIHLTTSYLTPDALEYGNAIKVSIYDLKNNLVKDTVFSKSIKTPDSYLNYDVKLCPGIYKIESSLTETYKASNFANSTNSYSWACTNCSSWDYESLSAVDGCSYNNSISATDSMLNPSFKLAPGNRMQFSAWVREDCNSAVCNKPGYQKIHIELQFPGTDMPSVGIVPSGPIVEGWQKIEGEFFVPANATTASIVLSNDSNQNVYFDDIRMHPFNANMKSYVYDPVTLRLVADLDENNFASFYEYDEEGQLVRVKKETVQGIKTIRETRSARQKVITDLQ